MDPVTSSGHSQIAVRLTLEQTHGSRHINFVLFVVKSSSVLILSISSNENVEGYISFAIIFNFMYNYRAKVLLRAVLN